MTITDDASFLVTTAMDSSEAGTDSADSTSVSWIVALWGELSVVELDSEASTTADC